MKTLKPGEIAAYCDVHQRTVSRWIANGQLKGHKLPGRGNYRVVLDDFVRFLQQQQMPMPLELQQHQVYAANVTEAAPEQILTERVLVIDAPQELQVARTLARDNTSAEQVQAILKAQLAREERLRHADDVVVNDGDLAALHQQIDRLHHFYLTLRGGQP